MPKLPRLLVAYSMTSTHVQTTLDYLQAVERYSGCDVSYLHVTHDARIEFEFAGFDIIFHNYCARLVFDGYVSQSYRTALRAFDGLRVLAVQDEYDATDTLKAAIKDLGFHIVLTCVPQEHIDDVYPRVEFPGVEFITVLTGYVPDQFARNAPPSPPLAERPIIVGYRGRDLGPVYGRLGREKFEVGERMRVICDRLGISNDIAMDEASRIYGPAWFQFIGSCRSMLGSESGSNVFDFDGSIRRRFVEMSAAGGRPPTHAEFAPVIEKIDGVINMGQISPRVFECAVMRTPMILLRGRYSGVLDADVHYIALKKDYSNLEAVIARLDDVPALAAMADRAYQHIVTSGQFGYRQFWAMLSHRFKSRIATLPRSSALEHGLTQAAIERLLAKRHPLSEIPSEFPKGMADYRRQQALVNQAELGVIAGSFWTALMTYLPRGFKLRVARVLKASLDAKRQGRSLSTVGRLYVAIWKWLPPSMRSNLESSMGIIDYVRHERK